MKKIFKHIFTVILVLTSNLFPQDAIKIDIDLIQKKLPFGLVAKVPANKPEVTLALSGGGARGIAQIGTIKALIEAGIGFDKIVGTSMGSIIGGLLSIGYTIDEIDSILVTTDWGSLLSLSETKRDDLFVEQKITEDREIFSIRFDGFEPVIPTSLTTGQKVMNFLNAITFNAPLHVRDEFRNLLYDYSAVSTDLITGEAKILRRGSLSRAMRASSSVSFLLPPVKIDSMLLVDGGLVANVPVIPAAEIGSDYIIAVNTTSSLRDKNELVFPWTVADQIVSIPISIITRKNLEMANTVIEPYLGDHKNDNFTDLQQLIDLGYNAAKPHINSIKRNLKKFYTNNDTSQVKYFKRINVPDNANEVEEKIRGMFADRDSVSLGEVKFALQEICSGGVYSGINAEVTEANDIGWLRVFVKENPIIKFVDVTGVELLDKEFVNNHFLQLVGKPYNAKKILSSLISVLRYYRTKGYSLAEIHSVEFDEASGNLLIIIDEGRINNVLIEGNDKTNPDVILREFPLYSGDVFEYNTFTQGLENLRTTNLFDEIDISVERQEHGIDLVIKVVEKLSAVLRFGLKIDNEYFTQFLFDLRDENLLGSGSELGLIFFAGPRNRLLTIEHRASRIFDSYLTYKFQGFYRSYEINTYSNVQLDTDRKFERERTSEYKQRVYGVSISLGAQVKKFGNLFVEGRYHTDEIRNMFNSPVSEYLASIVALRFGMLIDSRDQFPFPTEGFYISSYYETAQTTLGGEISYSKFLFDYKNIFTIHSLHTIKTSFLLGFGDETLPLSQQFSFGGQNNFFGYKEYDFRGRQIFIASVEYQLKLPIELFFDTYVSARYDLGSIWDKKEQIKFKDLRHGIGASVSFDTPIGPADFSVGKSFLFKKQLPESIISWGETHVYFTIGYSF